MKLIFTSLVCVIFLFSCEEGNNASTSKRPKKNTTEWYEGGTLHKSSIRQWKSASEQNKLATCGDFIARLDASVSMTVLKSRAIELRSCINEATKDLDSFDSQEVTTMAAMCGMQLGY